MVLEELLPEAVPGRDQRRRWSPEVAIRSVLALDDDGGSQRMRVMGYVCPVSAIFVNSTGVLAGSGVSVGCPAGWLGGVCEFKT